MGIGYDNTGINDPSKGNNNLVQKYIGTAYDNVKCVADNMDKIDGVIAGNFVPILVAPNGVRYKLVVDNDGIVSTELIKRGEDGY